MALVYAAVRSKGSEGLLEVKAVKRTLTGRVLNLARGLPGRLNWRSRDALCLALSLPLLPSGVRRRLYRGLLGYEIHSRFSPLVRIVGTGQLTVGDGGFVNTECLFDLSDDIHIGRNVHLAPRVAIYTSTHGLGDAARRAGEVLRAPVSIGDGCWIGANAVILPGVSIANGIVVAAGAVVTRDLTEPGVYGGVPAKRLRALEPEDGEVDEPLRPLRLA